jgi:diguanylate cyclase (GGDEF)-like protein
VGVQRLKRAALAPSSDDVRAMAVAAVWMYGAGGVLTLASVALGHGGADHQWLRLLLGVAGLALAGGLALMGDRLSVVGFRIAWAPLGTLMISLLVATDTVAPSPYAFFYIWATLLAAYFLRARDALVQFLLLEACYALALTAQAAPGLLTSWLLLSGTLLVSGVAALLLRGRLVEAATTDFLTGIANRRAFHDRLAEEAERSRRTGGAVSLVMMDIDHFKAVNDRFGHAEGDRCLRIVARALAGTLRRHEFVARLGGEEFAVIAVDSTAAEAAALAERLRARVLAETTAGGIPVTVSCGVASLHDHGASVDRLLVAADGALYEAKRSGRDRVGVAPEALRPVPAGRLASSA